MAPKLEAFLEAHAKNIPARLQAGLALLERLRDCPSLSLSDHRDPGSAGAKSHETYGNRAHERLNLQPINKNHGRRSSNLQNGAKTFLIQSLQLALQTRRRRSGTVLFPRRRPFLPSLSETYSNKNPWWCGSRGGVRKL